MIPVTKPFLPPLVEYNETIPTASVMIRSRILKSKPENTSSSDLPLAMGDIVTYLHAISQGRGHFLEKPMCAKRKNATSISRNRDYNWHIRIRSFFAWSVVAQFAPDEHRKAARKRVAKSARTILLKQRNYPKPILLGIAWRGVRADFKTFTGLA